MSTEQPRWEKRQWKEVQHFSLTETQTKDKMSVMLFDLDISVRKFLIKPIMGESH